MRRLPLFLLVIASTALLGGCNFFNRGDDADVTETPPDEASPDVVVENGGDSEDLPTPAQSDFPDPVVASDGTVTVVAPDLIQSTNPTERAIGVQRSRPDPFASLPIPPTPPEPVVAPTARGTAPRTQATGSASRGGASATAASPTASAPTTRPPSSGAAAASSATTSGNNTNRTPTLTAANPSVTALPTVPQPTAARAVRVSGVVQIGGTPYAIVQVPNEVERYVRAGERIAGGSVLVKRIDTRSFEPSVVLEQNGIEVVTSVTSGGDGVAGAPPAPPSDDAQASLASLPVLPTPGL
ncbi:MAG: hypothetical protein AAFY78_16120 [Cyanobacteria bacterium J06648_16]